MCLSNMAYTYEVATLRFARQRASEHEGFSNISETRETCEILRIL